MQDAPPNVTRQHRHLLKGKANHPLSCTSSFTKICYDSDTHTPTSQQEKITPPPVPQKNPLPPPVIHLFTFSVPIAFYAFYACGHYLCPSRYGSAECRPFPSTSVPEPRTPILTRTFGHPFKTNRKETSHDLDMLARLCSIDQGSNPQNSSLAKRRSQCAAITLILLRIAF